ncbi:hypothetical protein FOA52_010937, partial [Chlamydomonas sp. UWO 241]
PKLDQLTEFEERIRRARAAPPLLPLRDEHSSPGSCDGQALPVSPRRPLSGRQAPDGAGASSRVAIESKSSSSGPGASGGAAGRGVAPASAPVSYDEVNRQLEAAEAVMARRQQQAAREEEFIRDIYRSNNSGSGQ